MTPTPCTIQSFDCKMCGHCCEGTGGIVMTPKDRERLAAHLGLDVDEMLERYAEKSGHKFHLNAGDDGYCVFFVADKGCSVHPGRPDICRAWPFFKGNIIDKESWTMIQEDCKGVCAEAGHACFRKEGLAYIKSLEVDLSDPDAVPEALKNLPEDDDGE